MDWRKRTSEPDTTAQANEPVPDGRNVKHRSRLVKALGFIAGFVLLVAIGAGIVTTFFPGALLEYVVVPKLKGLVLDGLGKNYALEVKSAAFSGGKDSLVIIGVRLADTSRSAMPALDSNHQPIMRLDRLTSDTITVAGLKYWDLLLFEGLSAESITVHSPSIVIRAGSLPDYKFDAFSLPGFLPKVSASHVNIENANVFLADESSRPAMFEKPENALLISKASLELRDFYLDQKILHSSTPHFFSKVAKFRVEDVRQVDSMGVMRLRAGPIAGNLVNSSMTIDSMQAANIVDAVQKLSVRQVAILGLDWDALISRHEFHASRLDMTSPSIELDGGLSGGLKPIRFHGDDLLPLPPMLHDINLQTLSIRGAFASLRNSKSVSIAPVGPINVLFDGFSIDHTSSGSGINKLFSKSASFEVNGVVKLNTKQGLITVGHVKGTERTLEASNIRFTPMQRGLKSIALRSVAVADFDILKLANGDGLSVGSVRLREPVIYLDGKALTDSTLYPKGASSDPLAMLAIIYPFPLPDILPSISAGSISVTNGRMHGFRSIAHAMNLQSEGDSIAKLTLSLTNFNLNRKSWIANRGSLFSRGASFSMGAVRIGDSAGLYDYAMGSISGNLTKRTLMIDSIVIDPLLEEDSFALANHHRTERLDFFAPRIAVAGVDYKRLAVGAGVFAKTVTVNDFMLDIYGDKRQPDQPNRAVEVYPHEYFQKIPSRVGIDSVLVNNGNIVFRERWPDFSEPAQIDMQKINVRIGSVSNARGGKADTATTHIVGDMRILGQGIVNFGVGYQLMNPHRSLWIDGKLGSMDASLFNQYLEQVEPFKLTGVVHGADFHVTVQDSMMNGTLVPLYDSLHVEFFRWDKFPPGLVSLLANSIFMRNSNLQSADKKAEVATISEKLDPNESLFWAIWLPMRNGVSSVVGIPKWVW